MGSTGRGGYRPKEKGLEDESFGIKGAVVFKGKIDPNTGLEPVGANKLTLKTKAGDGNNVLFQFKLSKNNKLMTIIGYKNGVPEVKCKVAVDSGQPSLDTVIAKGSKSEKLSAVKMKDLFQQSNDVKENQLGQIAQTLLRKKKLRKES